MIRLVLLALALSMAVPLVVADSPACSVDATGAVSCGGSAGPFVGAVKFSRDRVDARASGGGNDCGATGASSDPGASGGCAIGFNGGNGVEVRAGSSFVAHKAPGLDAPEAERNATVAVGDINGDGPAAARASCPAGQECGLDAHHHLAAGDGTPASDSNASADPAARNATTATNVSTSPIPGGMQDRAGADGVELVAEPAGAGRASFHEHAVGSPESPVGFGAFVVVAGSAKGCALESKEPAKLEVPDLKCVS